MAGMTLSEELEWRGFINQTTFTDLKQLDKQKWTFYHGFDASAPSQTVGNLAAMMFDKVFMRHGHNAIILAGGATSLIGDPGGKESERQLQEDKIIADNVERAKAQLQRVFAGYKFKLVNNIDWTKDMTVIDFLRNIGKHFSMTQLVQRDYIAKRLGEGGSGISYTEFSYTLLQGMDFLHLFDHHGVNMQLGGSDQWGNCISGVDLIRRARGAETHVMTLPLIINKATGRKFGKSEEGAVWLDAERTSPYRFYQFWLNADDEGVETYLKIFTELDKPAIDKLMQEFTANRAGRAAQKALAYEVTKIVHGEEQAETQKRVASVLFAGDKTLELSKKELEVLREELPVAQVSATLTAEALIDALLATGLASSKTEARRFLAEGAVYLNNEQVAGADKPDFAVNAKGKAALVLRRGKNQSALLVVG